MYNVNVNDEVYRAIDKISSYNGIDKETLINTIMEKGLNSYNTEMSGGITLSLPNPHFFGVNKNELREFLSLLTACYKSNKSGYCVPLMALVNYIDQRVFFDNEVEKSVFENYFYNVVCEKV